MTAWTRKLILFTLLFVVPFFCLTGCHGQSLGILNPKGIVTLEERKLLFDTLALMLIVVLPVIIMSFAFVYHYQVSHHIKDYKPNWNHSYFLEALWWGIPCAIIVILAIITFKKTHELDPYNRITNHPQPPLLIQAIALPWKWLFIYPQQNIATVNYLELPLNQEVEFWMTTDNVPMSALFIPQLGSQIYAMAGGRTRLHLLGNQLGVFNGLNSQFNGDGFSDMQFEVHVVDPQTMGKWVTDMQHSLTQLDLAAYQDLLKPTENDPPKFFAGVLPNLFDNVIRLYMNTYGTDHPRSSTVSFSNTVN